MPPCLLAEPDHPKDILVMISLYSEERQFTVQGYCIYYYIKLKDAFVQNRSQAYVLQIQFTFLNNILRASAHYIVSNPWIKLCTPNQRSKVNVIQECT